MGIVWGMVHGILHDERTRFISESHQLPIDFFFSLAARIRPLISAIAWERDKQGKHVVYNSRIDY